MQEAVSKGQVKINENGEYVVENDSAAPPILSGAEEIPHNNPEPRIESDRFERKPIYGLRPRKLVSYKE